MTHLFVYTRDAAQQRHPYQIPFEIVSRFASFSKTLPNRYLERVIMQNDFDANGPKEGTELYRSLRKAFMLDVVACYDYWVGRLNKRLEGEVTSKATPIDRKIEGWARTLTIDERAIVQEALNQVGDGVIFCLMNLFDGSARHNLPVGTRYRLSVESGENEDKTKSDGSVELNPETQLFDLHEEWSAAVQQFSRFPPKWIDP
jgi:hypothetical protein